MSNANSNIVAVAGLCFQEVLDRVTVHTLGDSELMGERLLDALQRRGLRIDYARFLSLDMTQPLPILLQPQAE